MPTSNLVGDPLVPGAGQPVNATTIHATGAVTFDGSVTADGSFLLTHKGPTSVAQVATAIMAGASDLGTLSVISGNSSGNVFNDLVFWNSTAAAAPTAQITVSGSPAARTYSVSSGLLMLTMASGTYAVSCVDFRTFATLT